MNAYDTLKGYIAKHRKELSDEDFDTLMDVLRNIDQPKYVPLDDGVLKKYETGLQYYWNMQPTCRIVNT